MVLDRNFYKKVEKEIKQYNDNYTMVKERLEIIKKSNQKKRILEENYQSLELEK